MSPGSLAQYLPCGMLLPITYISIFLLQRHLLTQQRLGLECARHFVRLRAGLVILACRDAQKGEIAKANIRESTKENTTTEIHVWEVDLMSFDSVKGFCKRAQGLERLDILVESAGIATPKFELVEGFESTITVNVISTFLMAFLLLDKLRETSMKHNKVSHLTVVSSDAHQM
jgi:retinol dehydrogenase-12